MKFILSYFSIVLCLFMLSACGSNSPTVQPVSQTQYNTAISTYMAATHKEIITNYSVELLKEKGNLSQKQKDILTYYGQDIMQGAEDEDAWVYFLGILRFQNHFLEPESNKPLTDFGSKEDTISNKTAIVWAKDGDQLMYETAKQLFDAYMKNHSTIPHDDPELHDIMKRLGHVVHVMQDMASPPHVRNDNHGGIFDWGISKYEHFVVKGLYDKYNVYPVAGINIDTIVINNDDELWGNNGKFLELANFTHNNFYSEDTIPDPNKMPPTWRNFANPPLPQGTGYLSNNKVNPLIRAIKQPGTNQIKYTLDDASNSIHKAYADILMPKAIAYSAAVIKYFLSEPPEPPPNNPPGGGNTGGNNVLKGRVYISNLGNNTVSVIDSKKDTLITSIPVGIEPQGIAVNPVTNKIYVTNRRSNTVSVIDGITNTVVKTITVGGCPTYITINPNNNRIYTNNLFDNTISVIDGKTDAVINTFVLPNVNGYGTVEDIKVNPVTNKLYIAHWYPDCVMVMDEITGNIIQQITTQTPLPYSFPTYIAINSNTNKIYALYVGYYTAANRVSVIDGATDTETTIFTPFVGFYGGLGINQQANLLYTSNTYNHYLAVTDLSNNTTIKTIPTGTWSYGIGYNAATNKIYIADFNLYSSVISIDATSYAQLTTISLPYSSVPIGVGVSGLQSANTNIGVNKNLLQNSSSSIPNIGIAGF